MRTAEFFLQQIEHFNHNTFYQVLLRFILLINIILFLRHRFKSRVHSCNFLLPVLQISCTYIEHYAPV